MWAVDQGAALCGLSTRERLCVGCRPGSGSVWAVSVWGRQIEHSAGAHGVLAFAAPPTVQYAVVQCSVCSAVVQCGLYMFGEGKGMRVGVLCLILGHLPCCLWF